VAFVGVATAEARAVDVTLDEIVEAVLMLEVDNFQIAVVPVV
jgi:hypothetical protein